MRAVLDTNVVVSRYLTPSGIAAQLFSFWEHSTFTPVVSEHILEEYGEVLRIEHIRRRHQMSESAIQGVLDDFREMALVVHPNLSLTLVKDDPDDDKFIECAVAGNAAYIVSRDAHLLNLKEYTGIPILLPGTFLGVLKEKTLQKAA